MKTRTAPWDYKHHAQYDPASAWGTCPKCGNPASYDDYGDHKTWYCKDCGHFRVPVLPARLDQAIENELEVMKAEQKAADKDRADEIAFARYGY